MSRPDLVLFSPLPPARNGIADYTASILPDLDSEFNLFLVVDDVQPAPSAGTGTVLGVAEYVRHERSFTHVPHIYQLGNNSGHRYLLPFMEKHPGLTTVHD